MSQAISETTTIPNMVSEITVSFSWYDYIIFTMMLTISVLIGIYFGCFGTKQSTASEYLMGGKKMKVFPIAMSLVASHISGITLLGVPADVYRYGAAYWLCVFGFLIVSTASIFVYLPVLFKLQITSVYEYLEKRFDQKTRMFSSFLFIISQFLFLPIVVYIPALAFSAATGINLHLITPIICGVCIFYTTIGGLKAVVWTDTLQFTVTLGAVTAVLILGVRATGGFGEVWRRAVEGQRLDIFDFIVLTLTSPNETTFGLCSWDLRLFGSLWATQIKDVSKNFSQTIIYFAIGMCIVKTASVITGLIIYARYSNCDPFITNQIKRNDQLLPYYVLDVAGNIPGLSGLFIAGVFSAGLSTLSAHLNCLSGSIYEDFIRKWTPRDISEQSKSNILKLIVVTCGIICTILVFVFEHLGGILPLAIAFSGLTAGPLLGMFTLGILVRRANSKGAFYGGIIGMILLTCLVLPAKYLQSKNIIHYPEKPVSTDACTFNFTMTETERGAEDEGVLAIFKISFYYYSLIGCTITMVSGLIISYCTKRDEKRIDEDLLSPIVRRSPCKINTKEENSIEYNTVEKALNMLDAEARTMSPAKVVRETNI
ncbi:sodium-coupled monocarboxylate transporter 2-like [Asbolus verrucosus]|uniref:Sodium-coupled monocarboxylate transporter 2-like n=1 Tax=Asbolus verrucosus TaxID=1661398 RepID=A0A482VKN8_ASBVE|nr:sodium-coupled monocarboxylate transporter 2-like [Asbolus verrucosus]